MLILILDKGTDKDRMSSMTDAQVVMIIKPQKNNNNELDCYYGH